MVWECNAILVALYSSTTMVPNRLYGKLLYNQQGTLKQATVTNSKYDIGLPYKFQDFFRIWKAIITLTSTDRFIFHFHSSLHNS